VRWSTGIAVALVLSSSQLLAQADQAAELAALNAKIAEAGTTCIGYSLAVQDAARENGIEDPRVLGSRAKIARNVEQLVSDQDLLDETAIYLEAIRLRDMVFKQTAEVVIPATTNGYTVSDSDINVMREGLRNCQEWHRFLAQRAALDATDADGE